MTSSNTNSFSRMTQINRILVKMTFKLVEGIIRKINIRRGIVA